MLVGPGAGAGTAFERIFPAALGSSGGRPAHLLPPWPLQALLRQPPKPSQVAAKTHSSPRCGLKCGLKPQASPLSAVALARLQCRFTPNFAQWDGPPVRTLHSYCVVASSSGCYAHLRVPTRTSNVRSQSRFHRRVFQPQIHHQSSRSGLPCLVFVPTQGELAGWLRR